MKEHIPVLLNEVKTQVSLDLSCQSLGLDATLGMGGHAEFLLKSFPKLNLIAIDKDNETRKITIDRLSQYSDRLKSVHLCFSEVGNIPDLFKLEGFCGFDFILADLGISSAQLDEEERGLSFRRDAELDMRMDRGQSFSAKDVLNNYSLRDLYLVFARGGVGNQSKALAKSVLDNRPIVKTSQFKQIANSVMSKDPRKKYRQNRIDSATLPFQAVRIEVNQEFDVLKLFLPQAIRLLKADGRLLVISFHSLEDQIVAKAMRWWSSVRGKGYHEEDAPLGSLLSKKAISPQESEIKINSRSRSSLLRVFQRNSVPLWKERPLLPVNM